MELSEQYVSTGSAETAAAPYRKKPVVIEAMQFRDDNREAVMAWCGATKDSVTHLAGVLGFCIQTLEDGDGEGQHIALIGDWIIKGVKGEFYPCKPDIFEQTYEPASVQSEPLDAKYVSTGSAETTALSELSDEIRRQLYDCRPSYMHVDSCAVRLSVNAWEAIRSALSVPPPWVEFVDAYGIELTYTHDEAAEELARLDKIARDHHEGKRAEILDFAEKILHGDDEYRKWLRKAAHHYSLGAELPPIPANASLDARYVSTGLAGEHNDNGQFGGSPLTQGDGVPLKVGNGERTGATGSREESGTGSNPAAAHSEADDPLDAKYISTGLDACHKRIAELEDALRPFALEADSMWSHDDKVRVCGIPVGAFRKAARVLAS